MKTLFLAKLFLFAIVACGQDLESYRVDGEKVIPEPEETLNLTSFSLTVEVFSVPIALAAEMKRARKADDVAYLELVVAVRSGEVVYDKFMEARGVVTKPVSIEQIREYIYPSEYDPPDVGTLPLKLPPDFKDFDKFITPATPTKFETRNLGDTVEAELSEHDGQAGALSGKLTYTHVSLEKELEWGEEESKIKMPQFKVQRINAPVVLPFSGVVLVGSLSDPSTDPARDGHLWMVFATVSRIAPQKN